MDEKHRAVSRRTRVTLAAHTLVKPSIVRAVREAALLGLVATITWWTAGDAAQVIWTPLQTAAADPDWQWLPAVAALSVTLIRLWVPAIAVVGAAALFGWWPASASALAVTAFTAAAHTRSPSRRAAVLGLAAATGLAVSLATTLYSHTQLPVPLVTELQVITAVTCLILPAGVQTLLGRADLVMHALRTRTHYLEENYRLAQSAARLQERSRIAQEMHDQLGHRLSLIAMYAGALELASAARTSNGGAEVKLIRGTAQTAMRELRATLGILRTDEPTAAVLQPVAETGLRSEITRMVGQSQAAGIDVRLIWRGADLDDVETPVRWAVHRIVREGLTNVHRHAAGSSAVVTIERDPDLVRVTVTSDGARAPAREASTFPPGTGMGLVGAQERVLLLGGEFAAGPTPGGGFRLSAELPVRAAKPISRTVTPAALPPAADGPAPSAERWSRHGRSAVLASGLVSIGGLVALVVTYLPWYYEFPPVPDQPTTDMGIRVGMTRAQLGPLLNDDDPVARLAAPKVETYPPPAGSDCVYTSIWTSANEVRIIRYCFRKDLLIALDRFIVRPGNQTEANP